LATRHIDVVFLSSYNRYQGRLGYSEAKLASLRHLQLQHLSNPLSCLTIARAIVIGKLTNQRTLLQRQQGQLSNRKVQQKVSILSA
jgi:CRISPR-associated protein Cas1